MSRIKNSNFYVVNGWMVNDLKLTGRELQVYAIIYGFTQDDDTEFSGSLNYIAEWLGTSNRVTVTRAIKRQKNKGLITKRQTSSKGVLTNWYKVVWPYPAQKNVGSTETIQGGSTKTVQGGSTETVQGVVPERYRVGTEMVQGVSTEMVQGVSTETVHNIYTHKDSHNNIDNLLVKKEEKNDPVPYQKIKELFNSTCKSLSKVITVSANRKRAIAARWKEYDESIEAFEKLFTLTEESDFLKGANERHWVATFDWLMKSANMTKVLEGNYKNKGSVKYGSGTNPTEPPRAKTQQELEDELRKDGSFKGYPDFNKMFSRKEEPDGSGIETP